MLVSQSIEAITTVLFFSKKFKCLSEEETRIITKFPLRNSKIKLMRKHWTRVTGDNVRSNRSEAGTCTREYRICLYATA